MLLKLLIIRLLPFLSLKVCKDRKSIKMVLIVGSVIYAVLFMLAAWRIIGMESWRGIVYLLLSMFPHYLCYGFGLWLLLRCVWNAWSDRVWKRIGRIAFVAVSVGVLLENYWNPEVLRFFCKFFN